MSKILVVDDEKDIVELVGLHLQREGHEVVSVDNGLAVLPTAVRHAPDLIVLDIMLPGLDGVQVHRRLRADTRTRHIPVIMLTARSQVNDRITGLESGADDYLTKPFSPRELMLRIGAILRRSQKVVMLSQQRVGDFVLDRNSMSLTVKGRLIELTITELKLITTLMSNPDVIHSRSELLTAVWGYADDTQSRTLDTHIKRLRDKLGDHGVHVGTLRRQGYLFRTKVGEPQEA
ncbi:response regulator transcription factor [Prosthecobacter sp.]|jgi:two-component system phosphate regulon response regulator PhoB|uniref:response regulator transcription factor n=1 Tax=Prosthecobacter sp. TaxID=1965333 RepID=UPI0037841517